VNERAWQVIPGPARWNGEMCEARRVRVIVGKPMAPTWWCADLEGQEREAVEVRYGGEIFYLDDEDGSGWWKVPWGKGGPQAGHSSLPVRKVLGLAGPAPHYTPPTAEELRETMKEMMAKLRETNP
jgi:hypothetical protein